MIDSEKLAEWLARHYGVKLSSLVQLKTVYGVVGEDGERYIFKRANPRDTETRMVALHRSGQALREHGVLTAMPMFNRAGHCLSPLGSNGDYGYLQPWAVGRHTNYADASERLAVVRAIGQLHAASRHLVGMHLVSLQQGTFLKKLRMKQRTVHEIWPQACANDAHLEHLTRPLFRKMDECITAYSEWLNLNSGGPVNCFCHRDLAPHNLLHDDKQGFTFIDFDHAGIDDPIGDLVQVCNHSLFLSNVSDDDFCKLIESYNTANPLPEARIRLIHKLFEWPDVAIRTVVEWVRQGCPAVKRKRLRVAIAKERRRWDVLRRERAHMNV